MNGSCVFIKLYRIMAETEKFSKSQIATLKHIQKKGFAAYQRIDGTAACPELEELVDAWYLTKSYMEMFNEDVYRLTEKGENLIRSLVW
nr:MAG TPA: RNA polymerase alpha subunit [Caudoviricetes sp.]